MWKNVSETQTPYESAQDVKRKKNSYKEFKFTGLHFKFLVTMIYFSCEFISDHVR